MWDLTRPEMEPISPGFAGGFLTTGPPGKLLLLILDILNIVFPLCHSIFVPQCPQLKEIFIWMLLNAPFFCLISFLWFACEVFSFMVAGVIAGINHP